MTLLEGGRGARQTHAQAVSRLLSRLEALQRPILDTDVDSIPTRADADASYQQAIAALDEHNQRLGGVQARLESLRKSDCLRRPNPTGGLGISGWRIDVKPLHLPGQMCCARQRSM